MSKQEQYVTFFSWAAEEKELLCKPVCQELQIGPDGVLEAPEDTQLAERSRAGAGQIGQSRDQVSEVTAIKKVLLRLGE